MPEEKWTPFSFALFFIVTKWSRSRVELKGIFQEVALEPVEWFALVGDWGGWGFGIRASSGVYWCWSHRLKAFALLSCSTPAQYTCYKPAWCCLIENIHVPASAVLQGEMFSFHWWELCRATQWCLCKKRKLAFLTKKIPLGLTQSEWPRQCQVPVDPSCLELGVAVIKLQDRGQSGPKNMEEMDGRFLPGRTWNSPKHPDDEC